MTRDHDAIRAALEGLKRDGLIRPADVIDAARAEESPLHPLFTWDDCEAAHQYRLIEARNLLRVYVVTPETQNEPVRALVSLTSDRVKPGGGYRELTQVLRDDELRAQLLHDALTQLRGVRRRYQSIQQLARVWTAIDEAEGEAAPQGKSQVA